MKLIRSSMTALAIAISLAACGDKGNDKEAVTQASVAKENIEKMTGDTVKKVVPVKEATNNSFNQILSFVPADTAYLFTNKKSLPKDVLKYHLKQTQQSMLMWESLLGEAEDDEPEVKETIATNQEKKPVNSNPENKALLKPFLKVLLADVRTNMTVDKLASTGLKVDGHSALYTIDLAPILRYETVSKDAIIDTIKRAEKASGYKVEWKKCGDYQCIESESEKDNLAIILVILDNQVAVSIFPVKKKAFIMNHLIGKSKPKKNYQQKDWDSFLVANKYQGYGDGYVNLKQVYQLAESLIMEQESKTAKNEGETYDVKVSKACRSVVERHLDNIPEVVFGISDLDKKSLSYELLLKTSSEVSTAIQAIPNSISGLKKAEKPIFDLGLNINFGKLREGLTQYADFLVKTAEELKCDAVKPEAIRKSMGSFAMATMMGADQFKAIYLSVNDLTMGSDGKPEKIEALVSVAADNPAALLRMLGLVNPAFATLKPPKDGSAMKLPADLVPPNPTGVTPDLYLSQNNKVLNLMVGTDKSAVKAFKTKRPAVLWNTIDSKRYYSLLGNMMQKVPGQQQDTESKKALKMMTKMSDFAGVVYTEVGADDRGISINYSINYN